MRHFLRLKKINLITNHRKSMLYNLSNSLIKYELLKTTLLKAKELRKFIEPIITISKIFSNFNIKFLFKKLGNVDSVLKLFKILAPRYKNKKGGYTGIYKNGFRKGDNASLAVICFI